MYKIIIIQINDLNLPRHPLDESFTEMVKRYGDLHVLILSIRITVAQKHDLVMVGHVVVGDGYRVGAMDGVYEAIMAVGEGAVVYPDMARGEDGDAVAIRWGPPPGMLWGVAYVTVAPGLTVVDVEAVDDDVGRVVDGYARPTRYVDTRT